jgi:hypothetical protein
MLARRLLLLVAVLLVVGAFASAVAPRDTNNKDRATTPTVAPVAGGALPQQGAGTTITETLPGPTTGKTKTVRAQVGDLIDLTVQAPGPDTVTIAGYDEIQTADPANPAHFSFFADEPGTFVVTLQDAGTVVGQLEIGRRT